MVQRAISFFLVISSLLFVLLLPNVGLAQTAGWSRPVSVSGFLSGSQFPTLAVDGNNTVHIVWSVPQPQGSLLYYSRWDGTAWSKPVDILFGNDRPALAVDGFGNLNLLFVSGSKVTFAQAYADRAGSTKGWSGMQTLNASSSAFAVQMAIGPDGIIHVLRTQPSSECAICSDILYQQSQDDGNTWSDPITLSIQPADRRRVELKLDNHGGLHAAWDGLTTRGKNQSIRYAYSTDHGKTWTPAQQFFGAKETPAQAAVGTAGNDQVILLWTTVDRSVIYYQVSNDDGISWGQPSPLPGIMAATPTTGFDQFDMVADSAGILHLAAVGRGPTPDESWLYHLKWDGKSWSKPDVVYGGPDLPEYPTLAVSNGNQLHLTWYTRGVDSTAGIPDETYQVWYSTMLTSSPISTPAPTFTDAPVTPPTAPPSPTIMPTATPPTFAVSDSSTSAQSNPLQQQLSVLAGVIPAIVLIGLVILLRSRPRHRV